MSKPVFASGLAQPWDDDGEELRYRKIVVAVGRRQNKVGVLANPVKPEVNLTQTSTALEQELITEFFAIRPEAWRGQSLFRLVRQRLPSLQMRHRRPPLG